MADTLEARITNRIQAEMGDLITEADLKPLVDRAIRKGLFEPRVVTEGRYGSISGTRQVAHPPVMLEVLERLLGEQLEKMVAEWLQANEKAVRTVLEKTINDGAGMAVLSRFSYIFDSDLQRYGDQKITQLFHGSG